MIICLLLGAGKHADPKKIFLQTYMYHIKENSSLCLTSQQTYITSLSFSWRHKAMALLRRRIADQGNIHSHVLHVRCLALPIVYDAHITAYSGVYVKCACPYHTVRMRKWLRLFKASKKSKY